MGRVRCRNSPLFSRECVGHLRSLHLARCRPSRRDMVHGYSPVLLYSGPHFLPLRSVRPAGKHRTLNDAAFALDHFPAKLLILAGGFRSATGRLLATKRHEAVRRFYDGMLDEVDNP